MPAPKDPKEIKQEVIKLFESGILQICPDCLGIGCEKCANMGFSDWIEKTRNRRNETVESMYIPPRPFDKENKNWINSVRVRALLQKVYDFVGKECFDELERKTIGEYVKVFKKKDSIIKRLLK